MLMRVFDSRVRFPNAPKPRDARGSRCLRDGCGVRLLQEGVTQPGEKIIPPQEEPTNVTAREVRGDGG